VSSGLAAHGYTCVNIDDAWEGERDEQGELGSNEKFPDMAALAADVHALGLKLGIYSSPGPLTCAGFPGSHEHERQDAATWSAWGIDYLKYDWCSYGGLAPDQSELELARPYVSMRIALDDCGRDIVYSLCQYGLGDVWTWGEAVGANLWRTTGDIDDTWGRMSSIGFGQAGLSDFAGPGHWNDPDMLVVGQLGWGPSLHPTRLTPWEQVTHLTLWSLLAAPLLIGCDLEQLDDFTLALLTNPEVLDVDQDPLGRAARRVTAEGEAEVWARPLQDGSLAVGLFNRGRAEGDVRVLWESLGLRGEHAVRDLWRRQELGRHVAGLTLTLPRHGAALLKVR
jgi:alpha-galactosidase